MLLRLWAALYGACPALCVVPALRVPQKCGTKSCSCVLCLPHQSGSGSQGLDGRSLPGCGAPFPLRSPSLSFCLHRSGVCAWSTIKNLRRSLIRNWRPVCSAVGAAVLGVEPAPFPSPLPPASGGAWPVCSRLASLDLLGPFVLWTVGSVFRLVNFLSLSFAVPQFKLVTQKSSLWLSSGHSGPVLTLSNAARSSPFRPHLLVANAGVWGTFLLGVAFRHLICGFYLLFPSQSGCPPRFKNFPQTRQCKGFLVFGNFLY